MAFVELIEREERRAGVPNVEKGQKIGVNPDHVMYVRDDGDRGCALFWSSGFGHTLVEDSYQSVCNRLGRPRKVEVIQ